MENKTLAVILALWKESFKKGESNMLNIRPHLKNIEICSQMYWG